MSSISIPPIADDRKINASVGLPLSKSISNRALMMHAISGGKVRTGPLSQADDTRLLRQLLEQVAQGKDHHIYAGNAGTVYRFLLPYLCLIPGEWTLDGDERMRERPIGPLVDALLQMNAAIDYQGNEGYPPLRIRGRKLQGSEVFIDTSLSSQFTSALMMIGPALGSPLKLGLYGSKVSIPYNYMTARLMRTAGVEVSIDLPYIDIPAGAFRATELPHEADWSAAIPWYSMMALSRGGQLTIKGLKEDSLQGDRVLADYGRLLHVDTEFRSNGVILKKDPYFNLERVANFDLSACPDLAPGLIVTAAAKGFAGEFIGLSTLKNKESDRMTALATELGKTGINCRFSDDTFFLEHGRMQITEPFNTYGDHRLAMAFAPLAMLGKTISIYEPEVVSKSYPGFWEELEGLIKVQGN